MCRKVWVHVSSCDVRPKVAFPLPQRRTRDPSQAVRACAFAVDTQCPPDKNPALLCEVNHMDVPDMVHDAGTTPCSIHGPCCFIEAGQEFKCESATEDMSGTNCPHFQVIYHYRQRVTEPETPSQRFHWDVLPTLCEYRLNSPLHTIVKQGRALAPLAKEFRRQSYQLVFDLRRVEYPDPRQVETYEVLRRSVENSWDALRETLIRLEGKQKREVEEAFNIKLDQEAGPDDYVLCYAGRSGNDGRLELKSSVMDMADVLPQPGTFSLGNMKRALSMKRA